MCSIAQSSTVAAKVSALDGITGRAGKCNVQASLYIRRFRVISALREIAVTETARGRCAHRHFFASTRGSACARCHTGLRRAKRIARRTPSAPIDQKETAAPRGGGSQR